MSLNHLDNTHKRWFAIQTKYKCEKFVCKTLLKRGITAYTPLVKTTKRYSSKVKVYEVPLINCYAFVYITKDEYIKVLETEYVYKFIKQNQDLISIPSKEINLLKHIVGEYQGRFEIVKESFEKGEKVEIIAGQLTGLNGIVVDNERNSDLLIELENIGVQLRIHFKAEHLRPVL